VFAEDTDDWFTGLQDAKAAEKAAKKAKAAAKEAERKAQKDAGPSEKKLKAKDEADAKKVSVFGMPCFVHSNYLGYNFTLYKSLHCNAMYLCSVSCNLPFFLSAHTFMYCISFNQ